MAVVLPFILSGLRGRDRRSRDKLLLLLIVLGPLATGDPDEQHIEYYERRSVIIMTEPRAGESHIIICINIILLYITNRQCLAGEYISS